MISRKLATLIALAALGLGAMGAGVVATFADKAEASQEITMASWTSPWPRRPTARW